MIENLENLKNIKLSRDAKVNAAFAGFFVASMIAAPLGASFIIGSAASNLLGAEVVKAGLNWFNRRTETAVN